MRLAGIKLLIITGVLLAAFRTEAQTTLISTGAVWKYLDNGTDQGTAWRSTTFDDSSWLSGPAEFGFGDGNEATTNSFGPDSNNKYITYYYRHTFNVPNAAAFSNLLVRLLRDDGAVVYLNNTEVFRSNMPTGEVTAATLAASNVGGANETTFFTSSINPALLVNGNNFLAVEVHQDTNTSSDISFNLQLVGNFDPAPSVAITSPTNTQVIAASSLLISANATDPDNAIAQVEFYQGNTLLNTDTNAPFAFNWSGVATGQYVLRAVAVDITNLRGTSSPVNITVTTPPAGTLIARGSVWKYLDGGVNPGATWVQSSFNDGAWLSGPGPLGAGDPYIVTTVDFGATTRYPTILFRKSFVVTDAAAYGGLIFRINRDDGCAIYLNGTLVHVENLAEGVAGNLTAYGGIDAGTENNYFQAINTTSAKSALVNGTNVIAVALHNVNNTSSDIGFDLEVVGDLAPAVSISSPPDNQTFSVPTQFTFSANATDSDDGILRVDFYSGALLLGSDSTAPYSLNVTNLAEGDHVLQAVAVDNAGATATASVTIHVIDENPPTLLSAIATTNSVIARFSKFLVPPSATAASNYSINLGVSVLSAAFEGQNSNTVVLSTTPITPNTTYTLTVNHVRDRIGQTIAPNSQTTFQVVGFTSRDIGPSVPAGSSTAANGGYNVTGGGKGISGTTDEFHFNHESSARSGDFDFKLRVDGLLNNDPFAKAGIMARETLNADSRFAASFATPSVSGAFFQYRTNPATAAVSVGAHPVNFPQTWLRLKRAGNVFTGYASYDGDAWTSLGSITISMSSSVYLGMAVSGNASGESTTARFRDFQEVTGGTIASLKPPVEPPGPSSRKTPFAITEIMYKYPPRPDSNIVDFIEIYNSNPFFEDISGFRITGDIEFTFPSNTVVEAGEFIVLAKVPSDLINSFGLTGVKVFGPYSNNLPTAGLIRLRNKENAIYLEVNYSNDPPWPVAADGTGHSLVLSHPSYGENDPRAWSASSELGGSPGRVDGYRGGPLRNVVINEFMANSDGAEVDFIELYNHGNQSVNLTGCSLSDERTVAKYIFPSNTVIQARGYISLTQAELGFGLSSGGETLWFKDPSQRVLDAVKYEAQASNRSSGRYADGAEDIYPLQTPTPGASNSPNFVHDLVINEIMYDPISKNNDDEFVEIYNKGASPIPLAGWRFTAGINYTFPSNAVLHPNSYVVVARNATRLRTNYSNLNPTNLFGNFDGGLANGGERVAIGYPDFSYTTNNVGKVTTNKVYVVVDEVTYGTGGKWGKWANEGGSSLELTDPRSNHRFAYNWADSDETQSAEWTTVQATGVMDNGAQTAVDLELLAMGEGEYLVDNVEVFTGGGPTGSNLLAPANSTMDGAVAWRHRGTHTLSFTNPSQGFGGGPCLQIVTTARGDSIANRSLAALTSTPSAGSILTIRAKVRWLKGWPEILFRTHGHWHEAYGRLNVPSNLGTPGAPNSRLVANAGPAIADISHSPVIPAGGENVVVSARLSDPNGISANLKWRIDPTATYSTTPMLDDGTGGDAVAGDGIYSATINGQGAGTMVAFYVEATDANVPPAVSIFPRNASPTTLECLVRFGDPVPFGSFGTYRQWFSSSALSQWQARPALSNQRALGTFVYGNFRAIYGHGAKYSGSPYHQYTGDPVSLNYHYSIDLPDDDKVLGTENFNKIHAPGNGPFDDNILQREQTCYWLARQLGLPWNYRRFITMYVNGNRRGGTTFLMEDTETPGSDIVESRFFGDTEGDLYKLQPWFETTDAGGNANLAFQNVSWCTLVKFTTPINGIPTHKPGRYRNNYLVRAANTTANNFNPVFAMIDAFNTPSSSPTLRDLNIESLVDMEQWMRTFAVHHSVGDWDHFGSRNSQNMYGYKPKDGKWQLMIWDMNIVLGNGSSGAGANLFEINSADTVMQGVFANPRFRRMYLRALKELCNGAFQSTRLNPLVDSKHAAFLASGITPGGTPQTIKDYINAARTSILNTVAGEDAQNFTITNNTPTTTTNIATISGSAPVDVATIRINGIEYPIVWNNTRTWVIRVPLSTNINALEIQAYNVYGQPIAGMNGDVTVTYDGQIPAPQGNVIFSEILYNENEGSTGYIELQNRSSFTFDLSGWRINGLDYTFPGGSYITNGQYLLLVEDKQAFLNTFTNTIPVFDELNGNIDPDGEALSLLKPGAGGQEEIVDEIRFENRKPWSTVPAERPGASVQLVDPAQDNSRVSNWEGGVSWTMRTRTGNIANGTNVLLWLTSAGNAYIDDITLVGPEGTNVIVNGDFESGNLSPWIVPNTYISSVVSSEVSHSGQYSLFLNGTNAGGQLTTSLQQYIAGRITTNGTYTLTFWSLPNTNSVVVNLRTLPGNNLTIAATPVSLTSSPGAANTTANTLPPYDPVWLNELQSINNSGVMDDQGEREPWIELYNSGSTTVVLDGYYLANNYNSNLTQWAFPPGTTIAPGTFKVIWADGEPGESTASHLHTSFRLNASTGSVALVRVVNNSPQITDYLTYSGVQQDLSYGDYPNGQTVHRQIFYSATPGTNNTFRTGQVFINEWMASNTGTVQDPNDQAFEDWFEIYNPNPFTVDLSGFYLTDLATNKTQYKIPSGFTVPANGFLIVWADSETGQNDASQGQLHVDFSLRGAGEDIYLFDPDGILVDGITFTNQVADVSEGRFADGASSIYVMSIATPGGHNQIAGGNSPPEIASIADRTMYLGHTLVVQAAASDPDAPGQTLTFSLGSGPSGVNVTPSGEITWTPGANQTGLSVITVRVDDSATPSLSDSTSFNVQVLLPPQAVASRSGENLRITFPTVPGKHYQVEFAPNLNPPVPWSQLFEQPIQAAGNVMEIDDVIGGPSDQRYYRIKAVD